jgi:hypothetical protein
MCICELYAFVLVSATVPAAGLGVGLNTFWSIASNGANDESTRAKGEKE